MASGGAAAAAPVAIEPLTVGPIVGVTTPTSVRLWGRGELSLSDRKPRRCFGVARMALNATGATWSAHSSFRMMPHFDFTGIVQFDGLESGKDYKYEIGYFYTDDQTDTQQLDAWPAAAIDWTNASPGTFKTAVGGAAATNFAFGSCRYILRILGGLWFDTRGDKIFRSIADDLANQPLDFFLMVGDQIYADDLNFFLPDTKADEFFSRYRSAFSQPHLSRLMRAVPTYMILDDHEIEDNWTQDKFGSSPKKRNLFAAAMQAYESYQVVHGPAFNASVDDWKPPQHYWYTFSSGPADVFVMDTRTERYTKQTPPVMIGTLQMQALKSWLLAPGERVKLVASSVPFFPDLTIGDRVDKWSAFDEQRREILDLIRDHGIRRVVFLSGDVHCSLSAELTCSTDSRFKVASVVSSSFFWPYPQGRAGHFTLAGPLTKSGDSTYNVAVKGSVISDDNYVRVKLTLQGLEAQYFDRKGKFLSSDRITF